MQRLEACALRPIVVRLQRDVDAGLLGMAGQALHPFRHPRHVALLVELLGEHAAEQPQRRTADVLRGFQEALGEPDAFLELGGIVHRKAAVAHDGGDLDAVRVEEFADALALRRRLFRADVLARRPRAARRRRIPSPSRSRQSARASTWDIRAWQKRVSSCLLQGSPAEGGGHARKAGQTGSILRRLESPVKEWRQATSVFGAFSRGESASAYVLLLLRSDSFRSPFGILGSKIPRSAKRRSRKVIYFSEADLRALLSG